MSYTKNASAEFYTGARISSDNEDNFEHSNIDPYGSSSSNVSVEDRFTFQKVYKIKEKKHGVMFMPTKDETTDGVYGLAVKDFDETIHKLKKVLNDTMSLIDTNAQQIKLQISKRCDEIKHDVDKVQSDLNQKTNEIRDQMVSDVLENNFDKYIDYYKKLRERSPRDRRLSDVAESKAKISDMVRLITELNNITKEMKFQLSDIPIDERCIVRTLDYNTKSDRFEMDINNRLKNGNFESINLEERVEVFGMCVLPNDTLVLLNYSKFIVVDQTFLKIKTIHKINDTLVFPVDITTDNKHHIYICDLLNSRVLMTDFEFNCEISLDSVDGLAVRPTSIYYFDENVYVSDSSNQRIIKFDATSLKVHKSFKVDFKPDDIRIANKETLVVRSDMDNCMYFCDLSLMSIKRRYNHIGSVFTMNGHFYEYIHTGSIINVYNEDGQLIEAFPLKVQLSAHVYFAFFNHHLVLATVNQSKLYIF